VVANLVDFQTDFNDCEQVYSDRLGVG
jgi:hypothetical protein